MAIRVSCSHCEALLDVADKYHYQSIECPSCGKPVEVATTDTIKVSRDFIEQLGAGGSKAPVSEVAPGVFQLEDSD
ncbi:MAG TPA: hypothetical protein DIU15_11790 [Deltaproteobacteria bacterium]|nr:hypothetical protein [Deltaproteobacteria bacterium]HCP46720.1 hypothetical protein [Deltaproteobacteria bacterium]|tara:strand:+ start:453 stop:680 length:228 start_codon:yes stop_codon:yes gene_type:complete